MEVIGKVMNSSTVFPNYMVNKLLLLLTSEIPKSRYSLKRFGSVRKDLDLSKTILDLHKDQELTSISLFENSREDQRGPKLDPRGGWCDHKA